MYPTIFSYKKVSDCADGYEKGVLELASIGAIPAHEAILAEAIIIFFNKRSSPNLEAAMGNRKAPRHFFIDGGKYTTNELFNAQIFGGDWGVSYAVSFALAVEKGGCYTTHFNEEYAQYILSSHKYSGCFSIADVFQIDGEDDPDFGKRKIVEYRWDGGVLLSRTETYE